MPEIPAFLTNLRPTGAFLALTLVFVAAEYAYARFGHHAMTTTSRRRRRPSALLSVTS